MDLDIDGLEDRHRSSKLNILKVDLSKINMHIDFLNVLLTGERQTPKKT